MKNFFKVVLIVIAVLFLGSTLQAMTKAEADQQIKELKEKIAAKKAATAAKNAEAKPAVAPEKTVEVKKEVTQETAVTTPVVAQKEPVLPYITVVNKADHQVIFFVNDQPAKVWVPARTKRIVINGNSKDISIPAHWSDKVEAKQNVAIPYNGPAGGRLKVTRANGSYEFFTLPRDNGRESG